MVRSDDYTDCQNEQQFKMKWLKINELSHFTKFCIETEDGERLSRCHVY